uniref:hypothetical protein n=1 Tax=Gelidibacter sp. TaxID=2018083 RepID=UPI00404AEDF2
MKILSIAFLFITLLTSSKKEDKSNFIYKDCGDRETYCTGFADGRDEASGWSLTSAQWTDIHNKCMTKGGCEPVLAPAD